MNEEGQYGLLALPDELLVQVLQQCGAKAVLRAAACCRRLLAAKALLAKHKGAAFASAMVLISDLEGATEDAANVCETALASMPPEVDFALVFLANFPCMREDPLPAVLECIARRLPSGTKVVGCTGRGIFGVLPDGTPAEIDPSSIRQAGISVLLGRVPGAGVHAFARNRPDGGWTSEASCREWMGLGAGLEPISLTLFTRSNCSYLIEQCLDRVQAAFPSMVVTGGIASGPRRKEVICFTASPPATPQLQASASKDELADPPGQPGPSRQRLRSGRAASSREIAWGPAIAAAGLNEAADKQFVGLVLCAPTSAGAGAGAGGGSQPAGQGAGAGSPSARQGGHAGGLSAAALGGVRAGAFTARGMVGVDPVFYGLGLARGLGNFQDAQGREVEMFGVSSAYCEGVPNLAQLAAVVEGYGHPDLALWAADKSSIGSYFSRVSGGQPMVVVETMSHQDGVLAAVYPSQKEAFDALLRAAEDPSHVLCCQVLVLAGEGYTRDIKLHMPVLAAECGSGRAGSGMVVVSCTAKGAKMYDKAEGVEARHLQEASKMPMAGVYCDGEIGPAPRHGVHCGVLVRRGGSSSKPGSASDNTGSSELQGFTTIVSVLGG